MLRELITSLTARKAPSKDPKLQPGEVQEILDSLPELTRELRARQVTPTPQPRSVCTSLKDLCEF